MDRKALRFILGRLVKAGQRVCRGDSATINEVSSLVSTVTENMIGNLPPVELCTLQAAPVLYTAVFESSIIHASIFGFSRAHEVIPLHDHPQMHGFIKVLRGSLKVTSFSFLDHSGKHWSGQNKVRFEEERVVTSKDGCIHLQPFKGLRPFYFFIEDIIYCFFLLDIIIFRDILLLVIFASFGKFHVLSSTFAIVYRMTHLKNYDSNTLNYKVCYRNISEVEAFKDYLF
uniref:2-aminoethanethiol dioxygenase n=1 Tax=Heterorhabditis bacteriophora TaxID=37862 RepID=A0A1I7WCR1_HETBA